MPLPTKTTFVTFDVYGTLIDWEAGIWDAFEREAARDGFTIERDEVIPLFHEIARQIVTLFQKTGKPQSPAQALTANEERLLALLSEGYSYEAAGLRMNISINTVRVT